jgi:arylsulfatase A-like enzyme
LKAGGSKAPAPEAASAKMASDVRRSIPLALLILISICACSRETEIHQPNVVLIIVDTLRADVLSGYGYTGDTSPALSRLAAEGVQLDRVLAQTSWTLPSIGSLLTSKYPRTLGLYLEDIQRLKDEADTLAEMLDRHGYTTFGITANPHLNRTFNFHQGFDEYVDSTVVYRKKRELVPEGKTYWKDVPLRSADSIFEETLDFVDRADAETPIYLQLNLMEVHEYTAVGTRSLLKAPYRGMRIGEQSHPYLQLVRQVTDAIGEFANALRSRPGWESALIIVTSDHGEGLGDHPAVEGSTGHGPMLYDSHLYVPLVMSQPGRLPAGRRVEHAARLLDLLPTVLELVGIPAPATLEGTSLVPLIDGSGEIEFPEYVIAETYFRGIRKIAAYGDDWKFFHNRSPHPGLPEFELQPAEETPNGAETNRADALPNEVARLREIVADWEERYERAPPSLVNSDLLESERMQLQAIGYLD